ncbi:MAG: hypothetical protein J6S50_04310, partial [Oscillospiraceae bacterium]|nr:hypothetical protein [Oscillospiraceae bacterium]
MNEVSELNSTVRELACKQGPETIAAFSKALRSFVENGTWVSIPGRNDGSGFHFKVLETRGKRFAAMYSDPSEAPSDQGEICLAELNKLLYEVFHEPQIAGIVIDPFTSKLCMEKHFLLRNILHGAYPMQNNGGSEPRNWGDGIPDYTSEDLMTPGEIQNFAIHSVLENDTQLKQGYTFISACDYPGAIPNLILERDGSFVFVLIKGYTGEAEPMLSEEERDKLLILSER